MARMDQYSNLFGLHMPLRLTVERELCGRSSRLTPDDSSYLLLHSACNTLGKIDYRDYMNGCLTSRQPPPLQGQPV